MPEPCCTLHRPPRPLTDGVVTLDRFSRDDVLDIVYAIDDEILRWVPLPDPYGETDARAFVDAPTNVDAEGDSLNFAIRLVGPPARGRRLAGSIAVSSKDAGEVQMGYWIAPDARGQGVASRAVRLLAGHVLASSRIERVVLLTHPANVASRRVAEGVGATFEGLRAGGLDPPSPDGTTDATVYVLTAGGLSSGRRRSSAAGSR